jgi:hypothetical protein
MQKQVVRPAIIGQPDGVSNIIAVNENHLDCRLHYRLICAFLERPHGATDFAGFRAWLQVPPNHPNEVSLLRCGFLR